jgi:hypothetical protein
MNDNFDEELTVTLRERAGAVPPRPDLAGAAIRQAHGIRRRRRIAGGVAAAALVAVAVPLGLQAGDSLRGAPPPPATQLPDQKPDDRDDEVEITPSQVTVQLPDLPAGDAPTVPYVDGSQLFIDGDTIDLGIDPERLGQVAYAGGTAYFATNDEGNLTLQSVPGEGEGTPVDGGPWSSPDQRYVAYLADGTLTVEDPAAGTTSTLDVGKADYLQSITFVGEELFLVAGNRAALMRWTIGEPEASSVDAVERATAVSPDGGLVADQYKIDDLKAEACTRVTSLDSGETLFDTCEFRVLGFSPDGRYAWGARAYADAEDTFNVVLDTATGEVIMQVEGPDPNQADAQLLFRGTEFESDTSLLIAMEQGENAALVRCDLVSGSCERATELADGVVPFEGGSPYRLLS